MNINLYCFVAPQGVAPPQLFVVSDTSIRVSWTPPLEPNGQITAYNVYIDDVRIEEVNTTLPGSHVVEGLLPYSVFDFKFMMGYEIKFID